MSYIPPQSVYRPPGLVTKNADSSSSSSTAQLTLSSTETKPRPPIPRFILYSNVISKYYFFFLTFSVYIIVISFSDSQYKSDAIYVNYLITYIFINLLLNYYLCTKYPAYYQPVLEKQLPGNDWAFCNQCQHSQPPRCRHCPLCQKCIVKRDHHCFFVSTCVGQQNQARFTIYCFYIILGLYIGCRVLSRHLSNSYYEIFSLDFYHFFPPVTLFNYLLGWTDFSTFFLIFVLFGSFITGLFTFGMLLWQLLLVICDLTSYEAEILWRKTGFRGFWSKMRFWHNIKQTYGPVPPLVFLLPIPIFSKHAQYHDVFSKI